MRTFLPLSLLRGCWITYNKPTAMQHHLNTFLRAIIWREQNNWVGKWQFSSLSKRSRSFMYELTLKPLSCAAFPQLSMPNRAPLPIQLSSYRIFLWSSWDQWSTGLLLSALPGPNQKSACPLTPAATVPPFLPCAAAPLLPHTCSCTCLYHVSSTSPGFASPPNSWLQ